MFDITLIHPKVVDFTIALFSMAILLDLIGLITKKEKFHVAAWINLIFAGAAAIVSVSSGLLAERNVAHNDAAHEIMERHEILGFIVLGVILVLLIWRVALKGNFPSKLAFLYVVIGLAGWGVMFTGAYYGGEMVFTHGVAVKAVPAGHEEAGHHHENESSALSDTMDQKGGTEDSLMNAEEQREGHVHEDGSTHLHNE